MKDRSLEQEGGEGLSKGEEREKSQRKLRTDGRLERLKVMEERSQCKEKLRGKRIQRMRL